MIDAEEVKARKQFYTEVAKDLISSGIIPLDEIVLREGRISTLVDGYAILNEAYKKWRIREAHLTFNEKIAALTCIAISTFEPFRALDQGNVLTPAQDRANEIFAMTLSSSIIGANLKYGTGSGKASNLMDRIMDIIEESKSETLQPLIVDLDLEIRKPLDAYDLTIHPKDALPINSLISIFELIPQDPRLRKDVL